MITSVFNKSKPINFIIVTLFVVVLFIISHVNSLSVIFDNTFTTLVKLLIAIFLIFLLDFIVSKNKLTKQNSFAILTFGLLLGLFPNTIQNIELLLSNVFIVFALRRIISLSSKKHIKKKLFDASFWIALATLFYFWAILFFALVIVALIYHSQNDIKNYIIPFVGVATLAVLLLTYNILMYDTYIRSSNFQRFSSLDFTSYNSLDFVIKLTVLITSLIWTLIYFFRTLSEKNKKMKPSYYLVAWASIIGLLIALISPVKNGSEFIFLFIPLSIIMGNFFQSITEKWFREVFVLVFVLTPIVSLFL